MRFCMNYLKLNAATMKDSYPLPSMDECIASLGETRILLTLDVNSGYGHVEIDEGN